MLMKATSIEIWFVCVNVTPVRKAYLLIDLASLSLPQGSLRIPRLDGGVLRTFSVSFYLLEFIRI